MNADTKKLTHGLEVGLLGVTEGIELRDRVQGTGESVGELVGIWNPSVQGIVLGGRNLGRSLSRSLGERAEGRCAGGKSRKGKGGELHDDRWFGLMVVRQRKL